MTATQTELAEVNRTLAEVADALVTLRQQQSRLWTQQDELTARRISLEHRLAMKPESRVRQMILRQPGVWTVNQVCKANPGSKRESIADRVLTMCKDGELERVGFGKYRLKAVGMTVYPNGEKT